jgi:hypothetical protein
MVLAEVITKDGGISADYTLILVIALCTTLISVIFGFLLSSINQIKSDVKEIRNDFHDFVEEQKGLNATFHERTKNR